MMPLNKKWKEEQVVEPNTKRLLQNIGVKDLVERIASIHLVDHNRIGNT